MGRGEKGALAGGHPKAPLKEDDMSQPSSRFPYDQLRWMSFTQLFYLFVAMAGESPIDNRQPPDERNRDKQADADEVW